MRAVIMTAEDIALQQHALLRQRVYADWRAQLDSAIAAADLLALWSRYKFVVLAHDERIYRQIGPLLGDLSGDVQARAERVFGLVMMALSAPASRRNHINALQHIASYIKRFLDAGEKQQWLAALADYAAQRTEFSVPAILLQQLLQRRGGNYVRAQLYPQCFLQCMELQPAELQRLERQCPALSRQDVPGSEPTVGMS